MLLMEERKKMGASWMYYAPADEVRAGRALMPAERAARQDALLRDFDADKIATFRPSGARERRAVTHFFRSSLTPRLFKMQRRACEKLSSMLAS